MRLSALSELGVIYVPPTDRSGLRSGPTHQPVETLASLRIDPQLAGDPPGRRQ